MVTASRVAVMGGWLALGLLLGCAPRATVSPRRTLQSTVSALQSGDAAALYALLPESARRTETLAAFTARMQATRDEQRAFAEALRHDLVETPGPLVSFGEDGQREAVVADEPEGWRVGDPGFGPPIGASLPGRAGIRAALRGFREALRHRGASPYLGVLSAAARGTVESQIESLADALDEPSALEVQLAPNDPSHATVTLPDGRTLQVVREDGVWRIDVATPRE